MRGPEIFVKTITKTRIPDQYGNTWQYHSRSDAHSKVACWGVLFDLLSTCPLLRQHAERRTAGFGINHAMHDYRVNRKKNLDLVICTPGSEGDRGGEDFAALADTYNIVLSAEDKRALSHLPRLERKPVGSVLLALEAKACMTEHNKARPRLYDELSSSYQTIHGDTAGAIAAGIVCINMSDTFVSPGRNKTSLRDTPADVTHHRQPRVTLDVIDKIRELPRRSSESERGFDALGLVVVDCRNDGSPVELVEARLDERSVDEILRYDSMVERISHQYATRFKEL